MQIIVRGKVVGKMFEVKRLIDSKGLVIARLYGDWVENYAGQELAIAAYDTWDKKEETHEVAISGLTDPLEDMRAGGER